MTMHSKRIDFSGSKDLISSLSDDLSCHILSFLPIKEAVSTSLLSKRWKNLFAFVPNFEFDDLIDIDPNMSGTEKYPTARRFMDFVDNVLALQGNTQLNRFHLKCEYVVDPYRVFEWISKVLERGVSDLHLYIHGYSWSHYNHLPSKIFMCETLARLKIERRYGTYGHGVTIDVEDEIFLPKLKTLHLDDVNIKNSMLVKLLSGCSELEELVLLEMMCNSSEDFSLSSTTLKRLQFCRMKDFNWSSRSMSFDIPNLIYLKYSESVSLKYPQVRFDSLVEASLGFVLTDRHMYEIIDAQVVEAEASRKMLSASVTNFLMGICNVKILYLFNHTVEVLNICCETVPIFENLIHLTIKTHQVRWKSLIALLKSSPNLETIIFEISHTSFNSELLMHFSKKKYSVDDEDEKDVLTCLSSSPVKVLKILKFGEICDYYCDKMVNVEEQIKQIKYLLKTMLNLEEMILNYDTSNDEDVIKVSSQLRRLSKVASSKCKIQVISKNQSISFTIPSSISTT